MEYNIKVIPNAGFDKICEENNIVRIIASDRHDKVC
jgi:hypothetical protein